MFEANGSIGPDFLTKVLSYIFTSSVTVPVRKWGS